MKGISNSKRGLSSTIVMMDTQFQAIFGHTEDLKEMKWKFYKFSEQNSDFCQRLSSLCILQSSTVHFLDIKLYENFFSLIDAFNIFSGDFSRKREEFLELFEIELSRKDEVPSMPDFIMKARDRGQLRLYIVSIVMLMSKNVLVSRKISSLMIAWFNSSGLDWKGNFAALESLAANLYLSRLDVQSIDLSDMEKMLALMATVTHLQTDFALEFLAALGEPLSPPVAKNFLKIL